MISLFHRVHPSVSWIRLWRLRRNPYPSTDRKYVLFVDPSHGTLEGSRVNLHPHDPSIHAARFCKRSTTPHERIECQISGSAEVIYERLDLILCLLLFVVFLLTPRTVDDVL